MLCNVVSPSCCVPRARACRRPLVSLNDFVRLQQQRLRDRQSERLGRLQVDYQLELGRMLDRELTGLGALENLVDVGSRSEVEVGVAGRVRDQTANGGEFALLVAARQTAVQGEL